MERFGELAYKREGAVLCEARVAGVHEEGVSRKKVRTAFRVRGRLEGAGLRFSGNGMAEECVPSPRPLAS